MAQAQLNKMGFKLNYRKVPQDTLYTKFCGVPKSNYVICPNVGWFKDFTDPQSLLEPTFKGDAIKPQGNVNWSLLDNKEINDAMTEASLVDGRRRSQPGLGRHQQDDRRAGRRDPVRRGTTTSPSGRRTSRAR